MTRSTRLIKAFFYNNPDTYPPIVNSARLLAEAGFSLDLGCRDNGEKWSVAYPSGVRVRRFNTRGKGSLREYLGFVARSLRGGHGARVFVGHDMHGLLPARILASLYRRPVVYCCHDFSDRSVSLALGGRIVRAFEQRFARTADLVIVPDEDRGEVMRQALGLPRPPLIVANAPIERAREGGSTLKGALKERGFEFERIVFRQGRIGQGHALEATIRSLPDWKNPSWGFVIMGPGESEYIKELQGLAYSLGVEKQFVVLPPVSYDQVLRFTPGADVGHALYQPIHVNNVHISTASNKIMEYLAAGVPLLVSKTPALQNLVEKHGCGLAADEESPAEIAWTINALLSAPTYARQMGEAARWAFETIFCYERQFAPALEAIEQLASRS